MGHDFLSLKKRKLPLRHLSLRRQEGATLFIVLVILVAMLILTVSTSQSNVFLERSSSNGREIDIAFQAAETGLRAGEAAAAMLSGPADGDANCTNNGVCYLGNNSYQLSLGNWSGYSIIQAARTPAPAGATAAVTANWTSILDSGGPAVILPNNTVPGVIRQPSYLIEVLPSARAGEDGSNILYVYRVTAKGFGQGPNSGVVLQSVYSPPSR